MNSLRPLGNRLLIQPLPQQTRSAGGLHLIESDVNQMYFDVLSVGPKVDTIRPGDRIICHSFQGHHTLDKGDDRRIVDAREVLAVIV